MVVSDGRLPAQGNGQHGLPEPSSGKLQTWPFCPTAAHLHYSLFKIWLGLFCSFLSGLHFALTPLTSPLSHTHSLLASEIRALKICQCQEHKDSENHNAKQRTVPPFGPVRAVVLSAYCYLKRKRQNSLIPPSFLKVYFPALCISFASAIILADSAPRVVKLIAGDKLHKRILVIKGFR